MSKELIVSSTAHETKVAILEDDELVEIFFERESQYGLAGSIYKGRVTRVLPGMQSAFVNIGLERDAFLYVSDFFEDNEEYDRIVTTVEDKVVKMEEKARTTQEPAGPAPPAGDSAAPGPPDRSAGPPDRSARPRDRSAGPPASENAAPARQEEAGFDRRDRRGRRGRRRRVPGRGFPESKYASRREPEPPAPYPAPVEAASTFEVLPGESLAKYSHAQIDETDQDPEESPQALAEAPPDDGDEWQDVEDAVQDAALEEEAIVQGGPAAPESAPIEELRLDTVLEKSIPETDDEEPPEAPEEPVSTVEPEGTDDEPAAEVQEAVFERQAAEAGPDDVPAELEAEPEASAAEAGPAAPEPEPEGNEGREASVRERPYGRRYLHRTSRRMRRRGGGRPDSRDRRPPERDAAPRVAEESQAPERASETSITDLLKEGQEIIVQIAKEPIGKKGARITSHVALPGRYLVYMPTVDHVGISRRIVSDQERQRLKRIVQTHRVGMPGGFIVRTAGDGQTEDEIRSDMHFLYNLWLDMRQKAERRPAPALIHHDLNLVERILRDQLTETFKTIWVDAQEDYERILQFVERFQPALVSRVKLYTRSNPIFDEFGITPELEKALRPKVWLKSGGYIVINQTEALVAIDVNTGKYVGKSNRLEDTIVKTNTDAVLEIVRQIRLRDLGGIIVVDFIDMDERKNRQKVMQALDEALRRDRAPSKILQFNDFGLVAITRKRVKQSLERALCAPCPYCDGSGYVKSVGTVIQEILVEAKKIAGTLDSGNVTLRVNPEVARVLKSRDNTYLEEVEALLRRSVLVKGDPQLHQERFDFN